MCGFIVCLTTALPVLAQPVGTAPVATFDSQFSLSNPGARSLGMGGAFVGRADDATAAYANPAGLCQLTRTELSIEGRSWKYEAEINFPGSFALIPSQTVETETRGVSFLSAVFPWKRWTFSAYRHQLADSTIEAAGQGDCRSATFLPCIEKAAMGLEVAGYSLAAAYRFDGGFSLGAGFVLYDSSVKVETLGTIMDFNENPIYQKQLLTRDGTETAIIAGLLWHINDVWSVGAAFREGSQFKIDGVTEETQLVGGATNRIESSVNTAIPDTWAIGAGFRASSRLNLNLEYSRVQYSQLLEHVERFVASPISGQALGTFAIDDANEFHFGLEYSFWNVQGAPALRLGAWYDPKHKIRFDPSSEPLMDERDRFGRASITEAFPGGEDQIHLSAGFGLMIRGRFQVDAAVDFSDTTRSFSISSLVRF